MKKVITILSLLFITTFFGQTEFSGIITYEIKINTLKTKSYENSESRSKMNKEVRKTIDKMYASSTVEEAVLVFNQQESRYNLVSNMNNEAKGGINLVKNEAGGNRVFYYNSLTNKNIEQDCEILGECFLVENPVLKWDLKQNSKIIGGYLCYQAISKKEYKGRVSYTVAWYTPQIPVNFGPKGYNGLPGLILELERGTIKYNAIKIKLNPKRKLTIKKPTKGKVISREEFNNMFHKANPKFKN